MKTGLILTPSTSVDSRIIQEAIANSDFYAEYDDEFGNYYFPEEESNYDELESQLENMIGFNANYTIEGIWNEEYNDGGIFSPNK